MFTHATSERHSTRGSDLITPLPLAIAFISIALGLASCSGDAAPSAGDFVGTWESNDGMIVQFNEDGTLTAAESLDELADGALEQATWSFDGVEFVWTGSGDSPSCARAESHYTVTFREDGAVKWTAIGQDPCPMRSRDLSRGPMRPRSP